VSSGSENRIAQLLQQLVDDGDMDINEALAIASAFANLTLAMDRFVDLAEKLYPQLRRHKRVQQPGPNPDTVVESG
jgi:hypothetical protein